MTSWWKWHSKYSAEKHKSFCLTRRLHLSFNCAIIQAWESSKSLSQSRILAAKEHLGNLVRRIQSRTTTALRDVPRAAILLQSWRSVPSSASTLISQSHYK